MENTAFGRVVGALVAPAKTFRAIAERPTWVLAFLVVCLAPVLPGVLATPKIDWEDVVRVQIERSGADVPAEQIDQGVAMWEKIGPFLTYLGPLMVAIAILMFTVVLWGAFTLAGGQPGFKRSLAVTSHAMLPIAVDGRVWVAGAIAIVVLSLVVGLLPALRARRLKIVDALAGR